MFEPTIEFGMDPEAFLSRNGKIIGSEKVIPERGIGFGYVVRDGIQIELHPPQAKSRTLLATNLKSALTALKARLQEVGDVEAVFNSVVTVEKEELDSLSPKSREWLCQPSKNIYGHKPEKRDAATYPFRAAGGHMHFGLKDPIFDPDEGIDERTRLVVPMDILVGIPAVLIDRDLGQIERRKCYGMAGEFRLPSYGLEYRVLSNFWLRSLPLMSLFTGLAKFAIQVVSESVRSEEGKEAGRLLEDDLLTAVGGDLSKVYEAINENDADKAWYVWRRVEYFLQQNPPDVFGGPGGLKTFNTFARAVQEKGLSTYFPQDPLQHWCNLPTSALNGMTDPWHEFISTF